MADYKSDKMDSGSETPLLWARTILEDEFDDQAQNKSAYEGVVSGSSILRHLVNFDSHSLPEPLLNAGSGGSILSNDCNLEPCLRRHNEGKPCATVVGWLEKIPLESATFGSVMVWGTFCFVRSQVDSLMEINRVLKNEGVLLMDVVTYTTMPLAQTVNPLSFLRWLELFGFNVQAQVHFGPSYHKRLGIRAVKYRDFDPAYFRMPQAQGGKIGNYLASRDWYMR